MFGFQVRNLACVKSNGMALGFANVWPGGFLQNSLSPHSRDWQGAQMAGSLCVCVGGRVYKYSWNWLMHYVESCKLWSLPSLGVYYLSCIHDVKYNNSLTKMKEWWNKALSDSRSHLQFFLLFTSIHKTNWEENLAIYQNHLGKVYVEARMLRNWTIKGATVPRKANSFSL